MPSSLFRDSQNGRNIHSDWQEPTPRNPVPSFMEYKGLERQGVLDNMMPLGSMPSTKAKAKARADPLKKTILSRQGDAFAQDESQSATDNFGASDDGSFDVVSTTKVRGTRLATVEADRQARAATPKEDVAVENSVGSVSTPSNLRLTRPTTSTEEGPRRISSSLRSATRSMSSREAREGQQRAAADSNSAQVFSISPLPSAPQRNPMQPGTIFDRAFKEASRRTTVSMGNAMPWLHIAAQQDLDFAKALFEVSKKNATPDHFKFYSRKLHGIKKQVRSFMDDPTAQPPFRSPVQTPKIGLASGRVVHTPPNNRSERDKLFSVDTVNKKHSGGVSGSRQQSIDVNGKDFHQVSPRGFTTHDHRSASKQSNASVPSFAQLLSETTSAPQTTEISSILPSTPRRLRSTRRSLHVETPAGSESMSRQSTSSLSDIDQLVIDSGPPPASANRKSLLNHAASAKRNSSVLEEDATADEAECRKKRLRLTYAKLEEHLSSERNPVDGPIYPKGVPSLSSSSKSGLRTLRSGDVDTLPEELTSRVASLDPPTNLGRPPKRLQRKAPRVKHSPEKKAKAAVVAGIPSETRSNGSMVGDSDDSREVSLGARLQPAPPPGPQNSDNNEFCTACSGGGYLLCCEGCERSFHFICLDPPIHQETDVEDPWLCYRCRSRRGLIERPKPGLFAALLRQLGGRNPSCFRLPSSLVNYFENVQMGEDGEYVEQVKKNAAIRNNRTGGEEPPDWKRLRDVKGNVILCDHCGGSALQNRDIIPCNYCDRKWHLDCLSPPLAVPPSLRSNNAWMCPAHTDHDLRSLDPVTLEQGVSSESIGRTHRVRKPREMHVVDTYLLRGHRNNGLIEVANDADTEPQRDPRFIIVGDDSGDESSESEITGIEENSDMMNADGPLTRDVDSQSVHITEEDEFFSDADENATEDEDDEGVVYRLPEKGIKLDFISKVKSVRAREKQAADEVRQRFHLRKLQYEGEILRLQRDNLRMQNKQLRRHAAQDRQGALNLVQFATNQQNLHVEPTLLGNLCLQLMAEAPPEVVHLLSSEEMAKSMNLEKDLATAERVALTKLQDLISQRLSAR